MKTTFALCLLTLLCGCTQPAAPPPSTPAPQAMTAPAVNSDLAGLKGSEVKQLQVTPFTNYSKDLTGVLKGKVEGSGGAFMPLVDINKPDVFVVGFFADTTPEKVDLHPSQPILVSGSLKPLEDSNAAKTIEAKVGGKMLQQDGKYVYLVVEGDPWPAAPATPAPQGTP